MLDTILFDLDGTLLAMDTDIFIKKYFRELALKVEDFFTPEEISKQLWRSTAYMIKDRDKNKTNEEAFYEDFYRNINYKAEDLNPILDEFYREDFNKVRDVSKENEYMKEAVRLLKDKGYKLVVATNPLFPESAILNRIEWAGLDKKDFEFITSFEHMHFCKPNLDYYREILHNIEKDPSNCLMVGNDVDEDMVVKEIGMKTYLINEFPIGEISASKNIDHSGTYEEFYKYAKELPSLKSY